LVKIQHDIDENCNKDKSKDASCHASL